jgi:hypothetical protein
MSPQPRKSVADPWTRWRLVGPAGPWVPFVPVYGAGAARIAMPYVEGAGYAAAREKPLKRFGEGWWLRCHPVETGCESDRRVNEIGEAATECRASVCESEGAGDHLPSTADQRVKYFRRYGWNARLPCGSCISFRITSGLISWSLQLKKLFSRASNHPRQRLVSCRLNPRFCAKSGSCTSS